MMGRRSLTELRTAARRARTAYQWEEAIDYYGQALALEDLSPVQAYEVREGRAFCHERLANFELELEDLEAMERLAERWPTTNGEGEERRLEACARQAFALDALGEFERCRAVIARLRRSAAQAELPLYRAKAQLMMGLSHTSAGEYEQAAQQCAAAKPVFKKLGALKEVADCAYLIAYSAHYTGRDGKAHAERVLEIAQQIDDRLLLGRAYHMLGVVHDYEDPVRSLGYHEKALETYQAVREMRLIASATHNVGTFYLEHGLYKRAYALFKQSLTVRAETRSRSGHLLTLHTGATAAFATGNLEEAWSMNEQAITEARDGGVRTVEAFATSARGLMHHLLGEHEAAGEHLTEAIEITKTAPSFMPFTLGLLSAAYHGLGAMHEALETSEAATQWMAELDSPYAREPTLWFRYQALRAAVDAGQADAEEAWQCLDLAFRSVMSHAAKLRDRGLRRAYLANNWLYFIPQIVLEWAHVAQARSGTADLPEMEAMDAGPAAEPFKRLLAFGTRLTAQRDPAHMPAFILEEFAELSGAERVFLALRTEGDAGLPRIVEAAGMEAEAAEGAYEAAQASIDHALLARHAVLEQSEGHAPAHQRRSLLVVPLVTPTQTLGVLYADIREIFGPFVRADADLSTLLANQAAAALENARWTETLEQRVAQRTEALATANSQLAQQNAELGVINSVQRGLVARMDMQAIFELVGERIRDIFDAQMVGIGTFEGQPAMQRVHYLYEDGRRFPAQTLPLNRLAEVMLEEPRSLLLNTPEEFTEWGMQLVEGTRDSMSGIFVPILQEGEAWGAITLQNVDREYAFGEDDMRLLETLAHATSLALQNARLFDETQRLLAETGARNAELTIINDVQAGLVAQMDMQGIYELVGEEIRRIFDAQVVTINRYDLTHGVNEFWYAHEKGKRIPFFTMPISRLVEEFMEEGVTRVVNEGAAELIASRGHPVIHGETPKSFVSVPLRSAERVTGHVSLQNVDREHAFGDADVRLLETLVNSMSVALENARLFAEAQRRAREMAALADVGRDISATLDTSAVLERIASHARELLEANDSAVFLPDETEQSMKAFVALGPIAEQVKTTVVQPGIGIIGDLWQRAEAEVVNEASKDRRAITIEGTERRPNEKMMVAPLLAGDRVTGMMVVWRAAGDGFNAQDLDFLQGLARQASIAIENARLYSEAQAARAAAVAANESKSAFLANVSHELRTPLTSILGFARIVQKRFAERVYPQLPAGDARVQRAVRQIDDNLNIVLAEGERLTTLINNVLDLEKIEAGRMEWRMEQLSLLDVVEQAVQATASLVQQAGLRLVEDAPQTLPAVVGDRDKLVQVMINLISNAVKFTPKGRITCQVRGENGEVTVRVEDTGVGIAPEDLGAVFEKFRQVGDTLTDKPRGTGLGLPICKEIVEHHGGRIWVESVVGQGTAFVFALPAAASAGDGGVKRLSRQELLAQLKQRVAQATPRDSRQGKKVLVIDEAASTVETLSQALQAQGYEVTAVTNGQEGIEKAAAAHPDMIIVDALLSERLDIVQAIRFEKGLENVLFLLVQ